MRTSSHIPPQARPLATQNNPLITQENFLSDTIVDAKPYVPANWQPAYHYLVFDTGRDTTSGFVVDTADTSLKYRYKAGTGDGPAICRLAPYNNYEWQDYEFQGRIIKPVSDSYDTISVGAVFYQESEGRYYSLMAYGKNPPKGATRNKFLLVSHWINDVGTQKDSVIDSISTVIFAGAVDSVDFRIRAMTYPVFDGPEYIKDSTIISASVWESHDDEPTVWLIEEKPDETGYNKTNGYCGAVIKYNGSLLTSPPSSQVGVKFSDIKLSKVPNNE
jgi:hypothetical protein